MTEALVNLHASVAAVDGRGVIIFGKSGIGKTSLALELVREAWRSGIAAAFVADDRVNIILQGGELIASAPERLRGMVEIRGSGVHQAAYQQFAALSLAVNLVSPAQAERMPPAQPLPVAHGVKLPVLVLPQNQTQGSVRAILSHLGLYFPVLPQKNP
jgi:serine kinase of HPr protein (carbohydrate metabolism regulator)